MNKLPLALSLALSIVFASCSTGESDNSLVINGELATLYVGSYMVLIPDTYYSTEDGFISEPEALLHNAVPYVETNKKIIESAEKMNKFSITMNLLLTSKIAQFEVDSICHKSVISREYNQVEYEYTEGTYTIASQVNSRYMISYTVYATEIVAAYADKETGELCTPYQQLYRLKDFKRISNDNLKTTASKLEPQKSKYIGVFTVKEGDILTLENEDFTFEFNPVTGTLYEVKPEHKSLGDLERASQRLDAIDYF